MSAILSLMAIFTDPLFMAGIFASALLLHKAFHKRERLVVLAVFLLAIVVVAGVFTLAAKDAFQVPRPCAGLSACPTDYSFPSGHALISFAFFSFLFFLNSRWRASEVILIFPFLISIMRLVQGVHTIVDVVTGAAIGTAIGFTSYLLHERLAPSDGKYHYKRRPSA
jgi:undecaprenyl-diphosphatase